MNDININESKLTRVEVIDSDGRSYVHWSDKFDIILSIQDNEETLKVFIKRKQNVEKL